MILATPATAVNGNTSIGRPDSTTWSRCSPSWTSTWPPTWPRPRGCWSGQRRRSRRPGRDRPLPCITATLANNRQGGRPTGRQRSYRPPTRQVVRRTPPQRNSSPAEGLPALPPSPVLHRGYPQPVPHRPDRVHRPVDLFRDLRVRHRAQKRQLLLRPKRPPVVPRLHEGVPPARDRLPPALLPLLLRPPPPRVPFTASAPSCAAAWTSRARPGVPVRSMENARRHCHTSFTPAPHQ